ncbi:MAG: carboxypeptidase regulatory-like domain-containing protein [Thermoplasmata archaeon]|nr:carboxypeptidase regulatory-like domain-containing protein [Thermoplasmata archaeon]
MRGANIVLALVIAGMFFMPTLLALPSEVDDGTRAAGDVIEGVTVSASLTAAADNSYRSGSDPSDTDGYYEIPLPPGEVYSIGANYYELSNDYIHAQSSFTGTHVLLSGEDLESNISLIPIPPQSVTIKGYLKDEEGNGIEVQQADHDFNYYWSNDQGYGYSQSYDPYTSQEWNTDVGTTSSGYFEFDAPPGDFSFSIHADGYVGLFHPTFSASADRWANFTLEKEPVCDCWINGTVIEGTVGAALQSIQVSLNGTTTDGKEFWGGDETDSNGNYSINVPAGDYWLDFATYDSVYMPLNDQYAHLGASGDSLILDATLTPYPTYTINVQVNQARAEGVPSINVAWNSNNDDPYYSDYGYGETNNTGFYTFDARAGSGIITCPSVYGGDEYYVQQKDFSLPDDSGKTLTFELEPIVKSATINGTVTDSVPTRAPVASATVSVTVTNTHGTFSDYVMTDYLGYYEIAVPEGDASLSVSSYSYYIATSDITLGPQASVTHDFLLEPVVEDCKVCGYVTVGTYTGGPTPLPDDLDGDGNPDITPDLDDTTAPSTITDLAVKDFGPNYVILTWTAVGDDGTEGTASYYRIGYSSESAIVDMPSETSHHVIGPSPAASGETETFNVSYLTEDTEYWFAVDVFDDNDNNASSNIIRAIPSQKTEIETISPEAGGEVALGGATVEIPPGALSGDEDVDVTIERKIPSSDERDSVGDSTKKKMVGDIFDFDAGDTEFNQDVTITLPFDPDSVPEGWNLGIFGWSLDGQTGWNLVAGEQTEGTDTISVPVSHFSRYAVLATAEETAPTSSPTEDIEDIFGMLGYVGPVPILLIIILLAVVLVVVGVVAKKKGSKTPPAMPAAPPVPPAPMPPPYEPVPPPPQPGVYPPAQPAVAPPPAPPAASEIPPQYATPPAPPLAAPIPPQPATQPLAPAPTPAPVGGKAIPTKGKCSKCGSSNMEFYGNGSGMCAGCGYSFWWDKARQPAVAPQPAPIPQAEPMPQPAPVPQAESIPQPEPTPELEPAPQPEPTPEEPAEPSCPECGSTSIQTYPDGSHSCFDCENVW